MGVNSHILKNKYKIEEKVIRRSGNKKDIVCVTERDKDGRKVHSFSYYLPKAPDEKSVPQKNTVGIIRQDKISSYAEKVNMSAELLEKYVELYVLMFPGKLDCAGYRNLSNRFLAECLKVLQGIDVERELEERTRPLPFEYAISEQERQNKIASFCNTNDITADELDNAVKAYLDKYPDKITSNGHKHYSERFLNACIRYQNTRKT